MPGCLQRPGRRESPRLGSGPFHPIEAVTASFSPPLRQAGIGRFISLTKTQAVQNTGRTWSCSGTTSARDFLERTRRDRFVPSYSRDKPRTISGVAPRVFTDGVGSRIDLWVPLRLVAIPRQRVGHSLARQQPVSAGLYPHRASQTRASRATTRAAMRLLPHQTRVRTAVARGIAKSPHARAAVNSDY